MQILYSNAQLLRRTFNLIISSLCLYYLFIFSEVLIWTYLHKFDKRFKYFILIFFLVNFSVSN